MNDEKAVKKMQVPSDGEEDKLIFQKFIENFQAVENNSTFNFKKTNRRDSLLCNYEEHFQFGTFEKKVDLDRVALVRQEQHHMACNYTEE
jgi:hypothetical protein